MGQASLWSHRTVLLADLSSVADARRFVLQRLLEHDLGFLAEDVVLAASELATIAIPDAPGEVTLTLVGVEDAVVLTVRPGPPPSGPQRAARTQRLASVTESAARGLAVVSLVSRECGVNVDVDGVESVWASFDAGAEDPKGL
jgi:hypothetical protein